MDECDEDSAAASSQDTAAGGSQDSAPLPVLLRELHFWYIDPDGKEVSSKDQAAVTINGEPTIIDVVVSYLITLYFLYPHLYIHVDVVSVGFLIKCDKTTLQSSYLTYSIDHTR